MAATTDPQDSTWVIDEVYDDAFEPKSTVSLALEERLRFLPGRRSVWKAVGATTTVLLKAYDVHPKQIRDAEREWTMATKLAQAGLKVAKPLFKARHPDGRLGVVFAFLPNGETLHHHAEADTLRKLFQLVAAQHDAGFYQTDNHLGNYLTTHEDIIMLDSGSYQSASEPLGKDKRIQNLAILCATIPLRSRTLIDQSLSGYFEASPSVSDSPSFRDSLATATRKAANTRLRRYLKKTRRTCTQFVHEEIGGRRWLACRDLSSTLAKELRENPNKFFDGQPLLKDGNTCTVVKLNHGEDSFILKRYNAKRLSYRLSHTFSQPRALNSWSNGHALISFGVATPRPMACYCIYEGPLLKEAYLLMEEMVGVSLRHIPHPERFANAYASLCEELQLLQATHGDMKASNFITSENNSLTLIDLDSFRFHRTKVGYERQAARDRARFFRNWRNSPEVLATFRDART